MSCGDFILLIIALIFPPLPVAIKRGLCSVDFLINLLLSVLGFLPGLVHAFYIVLKYPEHLNGACAHHQDLERQGPRAHQVFPGQAYQQQLPPHHQQQQLQNGNMQGVYGAQTHNAHAQGKQQQQQVANYGATQGSSSQAPPAYSAGGADATRQAGDRKG